MAPIKKSMMMSLTQWFKHWIRKLQHQLKKQKCQEGNPAGWKLLTKNPLDQNDFRKYYQQDLSTPINCPDHGKTISSKSNLSKPWNTRICKKDSANRCWKNINIKDRYGRFLLIMFIRSFSTQVPKITTTNPTPKTT